MCFNRELRCAQCWKHIGIYEKVKCKKSDCSEPLRTYLKYSLCLVCVNIPNITAATYKKSEEVSLSHFVRFDTRRFVTKGRHGTEERRLYEKHPTEKVRCTRASLQINLLSFKKVEFNPCYCFTISLDVFVSVGMRP